MLDASSVTSIAALQHANRLFILSDGSLITYSLELAARVALGVGSATALVASLEKLGPKNGTVTWFRVGFAFGRALGEFAN